MTSKQNQFLELPENLQNLSHSISGELVVKNKKYTFSISTWLTIAQIIITLTRYLIKWWRATPKEERKLNKLQRFMLRAVLARHIEDDVNDEVFNLVISHLKNVQESELLLYANV